jgi:hypothetical protein
MTEERSSASSTSAKGTSSTLSATSESPCSSLSSSVSSSSISRLTWERKRDAWQRRFSVKPGNGKSLPWLHALTVKGSWGVGCLFCCKAGLAGKFASFQVTTQLQASHFEKHDNLPSHCHAVADFYGLRSQVNKIDEAPKVREFLSLWKHLRKGRQLGGDDTESVGGIAPGRIKSRLMLFCLAEGVRRNDRKFLKKASCITLSQDAAKGRLLARYVASDEKLSVRAGVLGMVRMNGGHKSVLQATEKIMKDFCTSNCNAPPSDSRVERSHLSIEAKKASVYNDELYKQLQNTIHVWNTDAGSDELLAGQEANVAGLESSFVSPLLPALKFVNRDRAHASRRVVQRPWYADEYLKTIQDKLVMSSTAMVSIIQHSPGIKAVYQECQDACGDDDKIVKSLRDLSLAKHRFESASRPLASLCLTLDAVNMTACKLYKTRRLRLRPFMTRQSHE